jgi:hypothetical protein
MSELKSYGWGIVDKDGATRLAHDFFTRESAAQGTIYWLNESHYPGSPFRVVQLFYRDEETKA